MLLSSKIDLSTKRKTILFLLSFSAHWISNDWNIRLKNINGNVYLVPIGEVNLNLISKNNALSPATLMKDLRTEKANLGWWWMISHLLKVDKLSFSVNKLVDSGSNSNYFIDLWDDLDRNAAFDIVKEVRPKWGKASRSTKIIDKKSVIQGVRGTFKDTMKIEWASKVIQALNSR